MTAFPQTIFDQSHYLRLIEARAATIRRIADELRPVLSLATALDAGCGVGFFSKILQDAGLNVHAFDGRIENVEEARSRFPQIAFEQGDVESLEIRKLGQFDLVLCRSSIIWKIDVCDTPIFVRSLERPVREHVFSDENRGCSSAKSPGSKTRA